MDAVQRCCRCFHLAMLISCYHTLTACRCASWEMRLLH